MTINIDHNFLVQDGGYPRGLREAAQSFEALFLSQFMRMAREETESRNSSTESTMREYAEDQFAKSIVGSSAFGIGPLVRSIL